MKIRIICLGKIKEAYLREAINDYLQRLKPYCQMEIVELLDEPVSDKPNQGEIELVKSKEGKKIFKLLKPSEYVIALDLNKKQLTSPEFAKYIENKFIQGSSFITFVIGGSYGLSDEIKQRVNDSITLSQMTFTHQMTRMIILEQIYRAFKINRNEVYHK